ncbi:MAG: RluA family pseudouridine synthase [Bacilli bacterium]|nr:RluA family pseudouridine synthase [Bacilli bacterium]
MIEILITEQVSNQRVDKFVRKQLNLAPLSFIYKLFRKKDVKVNHHWVTIDYILQSSDVLQIYVTEEQLAEFDKPKPLIKTTFNHQIVFEDEHLLIVNKPSGILVHGDASEKRKTLANEVLNYLYGKGEFDPTTKGFTPAPAHRLDRNTGGLVLFAKDLMSLQTLEALFKDKDDIAKYYLALVKGHTPNEGTINSNLSKDSETGTVRVDENGLNAITHYQRLEIIGDYSLLKVQIVTGRTHQIRVHLQSINHPIVGDPKYGDYNLNRKLNRLYGFNHQFLYAVEVSFQDVPKPLKYLSGKTFAVSLPLEAENLLKSLKNLEEKHD